MSEKLINAIAEMEDEQAVSLTKELLAQGADPVQILSDCRTAMETTGNASKPADTSSPSFNLPGRSSSRSRWRSNP